MPSVHFLISGMRGINPCPMYVPSGSEIKWELSAFAARSLTRMQGWNEVCLKRLAGREDTYILQTDHIFFM